MFSAAYAEYVLTCFGVSKLQNGLPAQAIFYFPIIWPITLIRAFRARNTMTDAQAVVLTIAGFDPSSGAGVTADIKTIAAHGCYGVACITAMTVQSTAGVRRVEAVDPALVTETLQELATDIPIAAVHIGMLGSAKVVKAVAEFLGQCSSKKLPNVVLDPILKSSSGADLLDAPGLKLLIERLIPLADVITPNVDEAAGLTRVKVT